MKRFAPVLLALVLFFPASPVQAGKLRRAYTEIVRHYGLVAVAGFAVANFTFAFGLPGHDLAFKELVPVAIGAAAGTVSHELAAKELGQRGWFGKLKDKIKQKVARTPRTVRMGPTKR